MECHKACVAKAADAGECNFEHCFHCNMGCHPDHPDVPAFMQASAVPRVASTALPPPIDLLSCDHLYSVALRGCLGWKVKNDDDDEHQCHMTLSLIHI